MSWLFQPLPAAVVPVVAADTVYKGATAQSERYLGTRTTAQLYLGQKTFWP